MTSIKDRFVLISVSDKTDIEKLARAFINANYKIIATGGTAQYLKNRKIPVVRADKITNFPEMLDGRVKTLHPSIFGGILANHESHFAQLRKISAPLIDVVVVNFYPFEKFALKDNTRIHSDMIDVGGVALLRAAAKNYSRVLAVSTIEQYDEVIKCLKLMKSSGEVFSPEMRKKYASLAFEKTSRYDNFIASVFKAGDSQLPTTNTLSLSLQQKMNLRYGENPHQEGIFCSAEVSNFNFSTGLVAKNFEFRIPSEMKSLGNKEVSYNNLLDIDVGLSILRELCKDKKDNYKFGCSIIKHNNPCGVAVSDVSGVEAYKMALLTDRISAFGGVVVFNSIVDKKCAQEMIKIFTDCVAAPEFSDEALEILSSKKNLTILKIRPDFQAGIEIRNCLGGLLFQKPDTQLLENNKPKIVTLKKPTPLEMKSLLFAYTVAKFCKSNAIVIASGTRTLGIGAGVTSRIDAFKLAASKITTKDYSLPMKKNRTPVVLASDGFFPFDDVVREAARLNCGISAIIQPGGSIRDSDSIKACEELGLAMVFAGRRHFRH